MLDFTTSRYQKTYCLRNSSTVGGVNLADRFFNADLILLEVSSMSVETSSVDSVSVLIGDTTSIVM